MPGSAPTRRPCRVVPTPARPAEPAPAPRQPIPPTIAKAPASSTALVCYTTVSLAHPRCVPRAPGAALIAAAGIAFHRVSCDASAVLRAARAEADLIAAQMPAFYGNARAAVRERTTD